MKSHGLLRKVEQGLVLRQQPVGTFHLIWDGVYQHKPSPQAKTRKAPSSCSLLFQELRCHHPSNVDVMQGLHRGLSKSLQPRRWKERQPRKRQHGVDEIGIVGSITLPCNLIPNNIANFNESTSYKNSIYSLCSQTLSYAHQRTIHKILFQLGQIKYLNFPRLFTLCVTVRSTNN